MMNARRIDAKLRVPVVKVLVGLLEGIIIVLLYIYSDYFSYGESKKKKN